MVLVLGILAGFINAKIQPKYGLDVKGGVRFIYEMDLSKLKQEDKANVEVIRERMQTILVNRASGLGGVSEPVITPKGETGFIIELPGYTDIELARGYIGNSARIELYHATTLVTEKDNGFTRKFTTAREESDPGNPIVSFRTKDGARDIKPGSPEYAAVIKGWTLILAGDELARAVAQPQGTGYRPELVFSAKGAEKMERWTRGVYNKRELIACVLDGKVLSVAAVQEDQILRDQAVITGTFTNEYVRRLVDLLNAGSLPVDLKEQSSEKVDPTIGQQALDKIILAGAVAFGVIALFLIVYYAFPGFVALIALLLYILFTLAVLKVIGASFSLAAIAGLILSVGMAVDANILVFERFKEEMKGGRSLSSAIQLGFGRALPAIIDSNACTILTSLVLASLGTGAVKGFATTLIIGVLISLFTAVFVTRSLLVFLVGTGIGSNPNLYALGRNWFGEKFEAKAETDPLPVVQKTSKWFWISAVSIVIGLPFVIGGGLKGNVEFRGGYEAQYNISSSNVTTAEITRKLEQAGIKGTNVKVGGEGTTRVAILTVPKEGPLKDVEEKDAEAKVAEAAGFTKADSKGFTSVGPAIQAEMIRNAILGVILSSALIILYLAFRFGFGLGGFAAGLRFGFSAIGALLHDVLFVLGVTAIVGFYAGWEISALFITSMLTVIGFSVHDTIVIFDRIRENLHRPQPGEDFGHLVNRSISQSFARSINTSMTVIVTLIIMLAFGTTTPDLKLFCATMLAGIISGTYSSIYNASPILWLWDKAVGKKKGEGATLIGLARAEASRNDVITTRATVAGTGTPVDGKAAPTRSYGQVRRRANSAGEKKNPDIEEL